MKDLFKTAGILTLIAAIAAAILGLTDKYTREPIRKVNIEKRRLARSSVLPAASYVFSREAAVFKALAAGPGKNEKWAATKTVLSNGFYKALDKKGNMLGYVFEGYSTEGYAGNIDLVIGVRILTNSKMGNPVISSYSIIKSSETPGLGKAAEVKLLQFFKEKKKSLKHILLNSKVDNNNRPDTVSGATVTSLALKDALYTSLKAATMIMRKYFVNLDVPKREMVLVPFTQKFQKISIKDSSILSKNQMVREIYEVKWGRLTTGFVAKLFFRNAGKKYLVLAGIRTGNAQLYNSKLFEITGDEKKPFKSLARNRKYFFFSSEKEIKKADGLKGADKEMGKAILQAYAVLRKMGKIR